MKLKQIFLLLIVSLSKIGAITTVNANAKTSDDTLAQIKSRGQLIVGADTTYAPFESIDPSSILPIGLDVDLAGIIAHGHGVK